MTEIIAADFYNREVVTVARDLLGMRLVRRWQGQRLSGVIIETEAYRGEDDLACHAHRGQTKRNAVMYGPPGRAYRTPARARLAGRAGVPGARAAPSRR